jgi:copper(I)-binding protein
VNPRPSPSGYRRAGSFGALLFLVASLAACSVGGTPAASPTITIGDPWVRIPGGMDQPAAGYLTISNASGAADALLSASSPGAASVELHQTAMDSGGMMGMHPVARLDIPAGGTVALAPGGYHLMIMGLKTQLKAGDRLELDLVFDHVGTVVVQAEVRTG